MNIFARSEQSPTRGALGIALIYALIGVVWIALSNYAVDMIFGESKAAVIAQTVKGWIFILLSAILLYFLVLRTVSSMRASEKALRESQRTLAAIFENFPGMIYRCGGTDPECPLDLVSPGAVELTGHSIEELNCKRKLTDLVLPEDREAVKSMTLQALSEKRPFKLLYRIVTADGGIKWAWEQGLGIYSDKGTLVAVEGFVIDVSERRRMEEALRRSEQVYRALVDGTSDAIMMVDRDRRVISVNQAFLDLFGYTRHEIIGHSIRLVHPSEESFLNFGKLAYPALEHGPIRIEWELKKKDGTIFPVEGTYSVITDPEGAIGGHVGIIRDITARKKVEKELWDYREHLEEMVHERTRELEEAQIALVQREKLKTLGAIAAEVAHEIRNPLVSIGGFARRLQKKYPESKEAEIILYETERLEMMLNRLREYLSPVKMKPADCHVNAILADSVGLLAPELEKNQVKVNLDLFPAMPPAHVDPAVLTQVFVAMIRNAVQIMTDEKEMNFKTYFGEHSVYVDMAIPAAAGKRVDPESMLLPFEDGDKGSGMSSTFKLLKEMGGALTISTQDPNAVFTVSLVKCEGHGAKA